MTIEYNGDLKMNNIHSNTYAHNFDLIKMSLIKIYRMCIDPCDFY